MWVVGVLLIDDPHIRTFLHIRRLTRSYVNMDERGSKNISIDMDERGPD